MFIIPLALAGPLLNAGIPFMEMSLSRDRMVFNLEERTGNIWMGHLGGP